MRIIKTKQDLEVLKQAGVMDSRYISHLEEYFNHQMQTFRENEIEEIFSLDNYGYIAILERGDNCEGEALSVVGLNPQEGSLLGTYPEFVNLIKLKDTKSPSQDNLVIYHILVLYDNEFGMNFFSEVGVHPPDVEAWLSEQAIE